MALAIATNTAALNAAASASSVNRDMETSMARLSTGKRINSASDDAAGVAISSRLSAEIRGTDQAIRNSLDGQALIDTAEGAHKEVENILQRMREVSVQAANDTNNGQDRANLQAEMDAMVTEIDRIASTTTWAGENLMKSSTGSEFSFQVGAATGAPNQISVTIDGMGAKNLGISASTEAERASNTVALAAHGALETAKADAITATGNAFTAKTNADAAVVTSQAKDVLVAAVSLQTVTGTTTTASTDGEKAAAIRDGLAAGLAGVANGMDAGAAAARLAAAGMDNASEKTDGLALVDLLDTAITNFKATTTDADAATKYGLVVTAMDNVQAATETNTTGTPLGSMTDVVAIGAAFTDMQTNAATYTGSGTAPVATLAAQVTAAEKAALLVTAEGAQATATANLNASNHPAHLSGADLSVSNGDNARASIVTIDSAIQTVNIQRSELGAVSNRLNHTVNNLTNISSNLSAAKGGIEDADFALETTNLAKNQILQQASTAMLAQANASKQNVLSLLQG
jgi:flagellin